MNTRQKTWLLISAAVLFIAGILLVWNDSSAGWFLIILGITYLSTLTRPGQKWVGSNPNFTRWGLIGATLLFIFLAILTTIVFLLR